MGKESESFMCVLPWNHAFVDNNGSFYPCCLSQSEEFKFLSASKNPIKVDHPDSFAQARQSELIKGIRNEMINGKVPAACKTCHNLEKSGKSSFRNYVNNQFSDTYSKILKNHTTDEQDIEFLDFRFGNVCNFKCRMCHPGSSSQLGAEFNEFYSKDYSSEFKLKDEAMDYIASAHSSIKRINVAGGEPLIIKSALRFIQKLSEMEFAKNITLTLNTNLSVIDTSFFKVWEKFKKVELAVSLDGLEELNHYIRYPAVWSKIVENLDICNGKAGIYINCTVQIYNVFYLEEFLHYFSVQKKIYVNLNILENPPHLSIQALPQDLKVIAKNNIQALISLYPNRNDLKALARYLYLEDKSEEFSTFKSWTSFLDKNRSQSLIDVAPIFNGIFKTQTN